MEKVKGRRLLLLAGILAVGIAALGVFMVLNETKGPSLELEDNAVVGVMAGTDLEERMARLQTQLDESKIAFSVNTSPVFANGSALGDLMLENPGNNAKLLTAQIVLNETEEVVYESKALKPGTYLEQIRLDSPLPKGQYPATVYLKAYAQDTQKLIGQAGAAITLYVEA